MADEIQLSAEQYEKAIKAIHTAEKLQQQMDDLEACGENCSLRRARLQAMRERLQQMINRFKIT